MAESIARLDSELRAAGVPIDGVSGGPPPAPVRVDYRPGATAAQRDQGAQIVAAFDWSDTAQRAWEDARRPERKDLRDAAAQAVSDIDAYLAVTAPTNAQNLAQVRLLSRCVKQLIRRLVQVE